MNFITGEDSSNIDIIEFLDESMEMCDITVDEEHCYFANDILTHNCAEEIRLAGILSGEPNFIEPFRHGKDVHTEMAIKLFGKENYNSTKRKAAKIANFGMLYGGNPSVLKVLAKQQGLDLQDEEAQDLFNKWWGANGVLKTWKDLQLDKAVESKYIVRDLFGRPRRLKHYLTSDDRGLYNFGVRTVASHLIQGSASSIMRNLLVKFEKVVYSNPKYRDEISYISSVHDEINSKIIKTKAVKWAKVIEQLMTYQPKGFPIPLDCGIEFGYSLGELFPFEWKDESKTELVPVRI